MDNYAKYINFMEKENKRLDQLIKEKENEEKIEERIKRKNEALTSKILNLIEENIDLIKQNESIDDNTIDDIMNSLTFEDYKYALCDKEDFKELARFLNIFVWLPRGYEFEIKPKYSTNEDDVIDFIKEDPVAMEGIVIPLDQIKKLIEYSFENPEEILNNQVLADNFKYYVEEMSLENKKAMSKPLKEYLENDYEICNLTLDHQRYKEETFTYPSRFYLYDEMVDDYENRDYFISMDKDGYSEKNLFNPLKENKEILVMHYSKSNKTKKQLDIMKEFFNEFIIPIIREKFANNKIANNVDILSFTINLFEFLLSEENLVEPGNFHKKIVNSYERLFYLLDKQIDFEKSDYINHLTNHTFKLCETLNRVSEIIASSNKKMILEESKAKTLS